MSFSPQQDSRNRRGIVYDHSSFVCPFGIADTVIREINDTSIFSTRLDPKYLSLREKIAAFEGVSPDNIVCGNSTSELVYRVVTGLRPSRALICAPTDSEYRQILLDSGCDVTEFMLHQENNFALTTEFADYIDRDTDIIIVCSPNYPTGELITPYTLNKIAERCRENNTIFVCDERYIQLVRNSDRFSAKQCLGPHIIVLRSLSDTFGMVGAGLAYAVFAADKIAGIVSAAGFTINIPVSVQLGGASVLEDETYLKRACKVISNERNYLSEQLTRLGLMVYSSQANFLLIRCELPLDELLAKHGIRIRSFADVNGLGNGFFGIAVLRRDDNDRIISEIEHIIRFHEYMSL